MFGPSASRSRAAASTRPTAASREERRDQGRRDEGVDVVGLLVRLGRHEVGYVRRRSLESSSATPTRRRSPPRSEVRRQQDRVTGRRLDQAEIGVFGGSGFYSFLDDVDEVTSTRPTGRRRRPSPSATSATGGSPSCPATAAATSCRPTASTTGPTSGPCGRSACTRLIGPCAAGSLQPAVAPGDFVVPDQLVDRTWGRADTFFDGPGGPPRLLRRPLLRRAVGRWWPPARAAGITVHAAAPSSSIQGPRFSTRAESRWYRSQGWEVINMTQYPEAYLARELGICYAAIALITDYDTGVEGRPGVEPVTQDRGVRVLQVEPRPGPGAAVRRRRRRPRAAFVPVRRSCRPAVPLTPAPPAALATVPACMKLSKASSRA